MKIKSEQKRNKREEHTSDCLLYVLKMEKYCWIELVGRIKSETMYSFGSNRSQSTVHNSQYSVLIIADNLKRMFGLGKGIFFPLTI